MVIEFYWRRNNLNHEMKRWYDNDSEQYDHNHNSDVNGDHDDDI